MLIKDRIIDPLSLKITDMRFADIDGAPKRCTLMKLYTNQGLTGYGERRDASSKTYALMLKSRILGENPCKVDRLFNKIKQFGGPSRQGGGVSGVEIALWDLAGTEYVSTVIQMQMAGTGAVMRWDLPLRKEWKWASQCSRWILASGF